MIWRSDIKKTKYGEIYILTKVSWFKNLQLKAQDDFWNLLWAMLQHFFSV